MVIKQVGSRANVWRIIYSLPSFNLCLLFLKCIKIVEYKTSVFKTIKGEQQVE